MGFLDLGVHQPRARREQADVRDGRLDRIGGGGHRRPPQDLERLAPADAPDALLDQRPRDRRRADPGRGGGGGRELQDIEEPGGGDVVAEFQDLRVVPTELLADPVGETGALLLQLSATRDHSRSSTRTGSAAAIRRK